MLTREGFLSGRPKLIDRYYVYKREGMPCRECGKEISIELMAGRKLYWCPSCQK
jgi:formamidopyrimidine-DNA glycosylase